ncbi:MAG: phosphate signaling complex protein PhoU [Burkholderiales bacterium]|jgi:phosphate transport system protein|nr:phosphate signaling complex protein PhoU [Burkholderiales bacterium]
MQSPSHTSKEFDAELELLRRQILTMGGIAEQQIRYSVEALRTGDPKLVTRVAAEELRMNELERKVDELVASVIARRNPTAGDLRMVMAILKTGTDLERIGDEAKKIALASRSLSTGDRLRHPGYAEIAQVAAVVVEMLQRSLDAFARLDLVDTPEIVRLDDEVDDRFRAILRQLLTYMIEDPRTISPALETIFVAKALERIGDHAKNISEYLIYMIKGKDVRHLPVAALEEAVRGG